MKKNFISALLVLALLISAICIVPIGANAADPNTIIMRLNSTSAFLNHKKIAVDPSNPDVSPFTLNSKTMVPVRFVQQLGADVKYTSVNEPVVVSYGNIKLELVFDEWTMTKTVGNGKPEPIDLPTPPTLVEGKTCVPIREIAEGLGFSVNYNSSNFVIVVSTAKLTQAQLDAEMKYGADNLPSFVAGVRSVTAKNTARSISVGGSLQLSAADLTFDPAKVGCELLSYSTSDSGTATVTSKGKVVGVADGVANITVSSHNGKKTMIRVTVGTGALSGASTFELLDGKFVPFASAVLPSPLNDADSYPISFKYDLNSDGTAEDITISEHSTKSYDPRVRVTVNGMGLEADYTVDGYDESFVYELFEGVEIVDVDQSDKFKEIAVYFSGSSESTGTCLFRYDGSQLVKLGWFQGYWWKTGEGCPAWSSNSAMTDLKGRITSLMSNCVNFTNPPVAMQYYQLSGNELTFIKNDPTLIYEKTLMVSDEFIEIDAWPEYYFSECSDMPDDSWDRFTDAKSSELIFKSGDTVTILKIGNPFGEPSWSLNHGTWYYVQLNDGRKGVLYFAVSG